MGSLHRVRVAAVGSEQDMALLEQVMLDNRDWLNEPDDRPPLSLKELHEQVKQHTHWEAGEQAGFLYDMLAPVPYGDAVPESCAYDVMQTPSGLWMACFAYDSYSGFQAEDWLSLHVRCNRLPMFALHADSDFALDKGMVLFSGGGMQENWDHMAEAWLWLIDRYESGLSPEEVAGRLNQLRKAMAREEWDQTIPELLTSCADNLRRVEATGNVTPDMLQNARNAHDFAHLYELQTHVAETFLWCSTRHALYLACLEADAQAWSTHSS